MPAPYYKPAVTTFSNSWTRRYNWAQQNGVPMPIFMQVYNLAQTRIQNGANDFNDEEVAYMLGANVQGRDIIGNPKPSAGNFISNFMSDLQGITTSLIHLPGELAHQVSQVIHDPRYINPLWTPDYQPSEGPGPQQTKYMQEQASHPLWDLIPFWSDLWTAAQGKAGFRQLESHPLYTMLDMAGVSGGVGSAVEAAGRSAVLRAAEEGGYLQDLDRIDKEMNQNPMVLRGRGIQRGFGVRGAAHLFGHIPLPGIDRVHDTPTGQAYGMMHVHDYVQKLLKARGFSAAARKTGVRSEVLSRGLYGAFDREVRALTKSLGRLSSSDRRLLHRVITQRMGEPSLRDSAGRYVKRSPLSPGVGEQVPEHWQDFVTKLDEVITRYEDQAVKDGDIRAIPIFGDSGYQTGEKEYWSAGTPIANAWDRIQKMKNQIEGMTRRREEPGTTRKQYDALTIAIVELGKRVQEAQVELHKLQAKTEPVRFTPSLRAEQAVRIKEHLAANGNKFADVQTLDLARKELEDNVINGESITSLRSQYKSFDKAMKQIDREVTGNWMNFKNQGLDPIYLPGMKTEDQAKAFHPHLGGTRRNKLGYESARLSDSVQDPIMQASFFIKNSLEGQYEGMFHDFVMKNYAVTKEEVRALAEKIAHQKLPILERAGHHIPHDALIESIIFDDLGYRDWEASRFFPITRARLRNMPDTLVPDDVLRAVEYMHPTKADQFVRDTLDPITKLFRFSLLGLSPRFAFHIIFGGFTMLAGRGHISMLRHIPSAISFARSGKVADWMRDLPGYTTDEELASMMPRHFAEVGAEDWALGFMGSRTLAKLKFQAWAERHQLLGGMARGVEVLPAIARFNYEALDFLSNMYRSIAFLDEAQRAWQRGSARSAQDAAEAGANAAGKVLSNLDDQTPFERAILARVFPFYAWQKHMLRYLWTYPVDHPYRTVLVSSLAEQWQENYPSGIPMALGLLFDLGPTNSQGNFSTLDLRQLNPFRTSWNMATYAGWISAMNPIALGVMTSVGVNTLDASPELYPALSYNTYYDLNTAQMTWQQRMMGLGEAVVPQLGAIDAFVGVSNGIKTLRQYDPQAYKDQLFSMLNIPMLLTGPQTRNMYLERAKVQQRLFVNLRDQVTTALQTGDFSPLLNFQGPYPYGGGQYTLAQLESMSQQAEQQWRQAGGPPVPPIELLSEPKSLKV